MTAKRESDLLIKSIISNGIGRLGFLLPGNKNTTKFEKETRHRLYLTVDHYFSGLSKLLENQSQNQMWQNQSNVKICFY